MMLTTDKTHIFLKSKNVIILNTQLYFFTFEDMLLETWYHIHFLH